MRLSSKLYRVGFERKQTADLSRLLLSTIGTYCTCWNLQYTSIVGTGYLLFLWASTMRPVV